MTNETKTPTREELFKPFDPDVHTEGHYWVKRFSDCEVPTMARLWADGKHHGAGKKSGGNYLEFIGTRQADEARDCLFSPAIPGPDELAALRRDAEALWALEGLLRDGVKMHGWLNAPPVAVSIVQGDDEMEDMFFTNGNNGAPTLADAIAAATKGGE